MSLQKACVLHMSLDEKSYAPNTRRFTDKSGFGNHGTSMNSASFTVDRMGQTTRAMTRNVWNDHVRIPDDDSLDTPSTLSVFCWVKGAAQHSCGLVAHYDSAVNQRAFQLLTGASAEMRIIMSDDGTYSMGHTKDYRSSIEVFDGNWHNIGFTFAAGVLKLYIDGVEDTNTSKNWDENITTIHNSSADVCIGAALSNDAPENFFNGSMSDVRIYASVLTQQEITYLYDSYRI